MSDDRKLAASLWALQKHPAIDDEMADAIRRAADRITAHCEERDALRVYCRDLMKARDEARDATQRLREERRWVAVAERLPERHTTVFVRAVRRGDYGYTEDEECMTFAKFGDQHYSEPTPTWRETVPTARHSMGITVTHWMPLPAPPPEPAP